MKKRTKRKIRNIILLITIIFVLLAFSFLALSIHYLNKEIGQKQIVVKLEKNASTTQILKIFNEKGIFQPKIFFFPLIYGYMMFFDKYPIAGTYYFHETNTNLDVIRSIFSGKNQYIIKVTYPEGITVKDFAKITQAKLSIDTNEFYEAIQKGNYIQQLNIPINSIEGYLMPETYFFYYNTDAKSVVNKLIETQNKVWEQKFDSVSKAKGLSRHFVLTLASIIELESPLKEERKRISGVFYNRLKRGMRLESDPTVQYALNTKKRIKLNDLNVDNPYNTYRTFGLPPGPICSPSISSIEAAIFPESHDYYYFVSYGDGSGRHRFAKTFSEHLKNKKLYKKALKEKVSFAK